MKSGFRPDCLGDKGMEQDGGAPTLGEDQSQDPFCARFLFALLKFFPYSSLELLMDCCSMTTQNPEF